MDHRQVIQESIDYIEAHLKTQTTAAELAQEAGYSLFHYYRLFQSAVGMPVMQYILRRRLIHAVYEISHGRKRIDVILEYGFDTYAGFYKAFRREWGCTPSEYLQKGRAKKPWKLNLYKEEPMRITHQKATEILRHWNLENEPISDIYDEGSGMKSDTALYVGKDYVLKFSADLGKVNNAIILSQAIENAGMLASSPVKTADGRAYVQDGNLFFHVARRVSGTPMLARNFYEGDSAAKARFVGEIIGQLHLILRQTDTPADDVDLYQTVKDWAMPKVRNLLAFPKQFCRNYLDAFGALYHKLPKQIIHRDPNPANIIVSQDQWGFTDFELSERNLRIYDPCYAATAVLSESFDESDPAKLSKWLGIYKNIIRGYDNVVKLTDEERQALPYVVMANQLICTAYFSEQDKFAELFETNKRMTLWLVSVFDDLRLN